VDPQRIASHFLSCARSSTKNKVAFLPTAAGSRTCQIKSGKTEIYVLPFDASNPGSPAAGGLHQVSKDGGAQPRWTGDGKELFYLAPDGYLMSVDVNTAGGAFQAGAPHRLFKSPATGFGSWDVSADGNRFLIAAPPASGAGSPSRQYHVVTNWTELLKR
jgi:hypothetical protein